MIFNVLPQNLQQLFNLNENNTFSIEETTLNLLIALKKAMKNQSDIATEKEIADLFSSNIEQSIYEDYITLTENKEMLVTYLGSNTSMLEALNLYLQKNPNYTFHILSSDDYMKKLPNLYESREDNSADTLVNLPISVDMVIKNLLNDDLDRNYIVGKSRNFHFFYNEFTDTEETNDSNCQNYLTLFNPKTQLEKLKTHLFPASQIELFLHSPIMQNIRDSHPQDVLVYIISCAQNKNTTLLEHIKELNQAILKELNTQKTNSLTQEHIDRITKQHIPSELLDFYFDIVDSIKDIQLNENHVYNKQYSHINSAEEFLIRLIYPQLTEVEKNATLSENFSRIYDLEPEFSQTIPRNTAVNICKNNMANATEFFKSIAHLTLVKEYCSPIFNISELLKEDNEKNQDIIYILSKYFDKEERNNLAEHHASFKYNIDYKDPHFSNKFLELLELIDKYKEHSPPVNNKLAFTYSIYNIMDKVLFNFTVANYSEDFDLKIYFSHDEVCNFINKFLGFRHTDNQHSFSKYIQANFSAENKKEVELVKKIIIKSSVNIESVPIEFFYQQPIFNLFQDQISWADKQKIPKLHIFDENNISREKLSTLIDNCYSDKKEKPTSVDFLLNLNTELISTLTHQEKNDFKTWQAFFSHSPRISDIIFKKEIKSYLMNHEDLILDLILSKDVRESLEITDFISVFPSSFLSQPKNLFKITEQKDQELTRQILEQFNEKLLYVLMEIQNSGNYNLDNINETLNFVLEHYLLENSCSNHPNKPRIKTLKF